MARANVKRKYNGTERKLDELISIGPAMLRDFELLEINSVEQLAKQNPRRLYDKLSRITRQPQDICVLDVFCAAVAQARNPRLAAEKCAWWWWSRRRKRSKGGRGDGGQAKSLPSRGSKRFLG